MPESITATLTGESCGIARPERPGVVVLEVPLLRRAAARCCRTRTPRAGERERASTASSEDVSAARERRRQSRREAVARSNADAVGAGRLGARRGERERTRRVGRRRGDRRAMPSSRRRLLQLHRRPRSTGRLRAARTPCAVRDRGVDARRRPRPSRAPRGRRPRRAGSRVPIAAAARSSRSCRPRRGSARPAGVQSQPERASPRARAPSTPRARPRERDGAAVGDRLRRRQELQERRREPRRAQVERGADLAARERHLRLVVGHDDERLHAARRPARRLQVGDRRGELQLLRHRRRVERPGPSRGTAMPCRTDRRPRRGTAPPVPVASAPRPCGRPRSRRRACARPCPGRARPGPSSPRRRRSRSRDSAFDAAVHLARACRRRDRTACPSVRFASAYERAATACAFSASGGHVDGISDGTTPFRYCLEPDRVDDLHELAVGRDAHPAAIGDLGDEQRLRGRERVGRDEVGVVGEGELALQHDPAGIERASWSRPRRRPSTARSTRASTCFAEARRTRTVATFASPSVVPGSSGRGSGRTSSRASRSRRRPTGSGRGRGPSRGR